MPDSFNNALFNNYGLSASHPTLPVNTRIELSIGEKTVLLRINSLWPNVSEANLVLSDDVAKVFGLAHNANVDCTMRIPIMENNSIIKAIRYLLPYIGLGFIVMGFF